MSPVVLGSRVAGQACGHLDDRERRIGRQGQGCVLVRCTRGPVPRCRDPHAIDFKAQPLGLPVDVVQYAPGRSQRQQMGTGEGRVHATPSWVHRWGKRTASGSVFRKDPADTVTWKSPTAKMI